MYEVVRNGKRMGIFFPSEAEAWEWIDAGGPSKDGIEDLWGFWEVWEAEG